MLKAFSNKGEANAIPINAENLNFNFTELINILHPVGEYFSTSDATFNPNTAWCGVWTLENDGTVLVSKSDESGSAFNINVGNVVGEEKHKLTIGELAEHGHIVRTTDGAAVGKIVGVAVPFNYDGEANRDTSKTGGDQPHNNIQPSRISFRWHRTA